MSKPGDVLKAIQQRKEHRLLEARVTKLSGDVVGGTVQAWGGRIAPLEFVGGDKGKVGAQRGCAGVLGDELDNGLCFGLDFGMAVG